MCHGGNQAFLELAARGAVSCGSMMVPCPWFREIAEAAAADPALDLGVHLTLTSEWLHYRWRPLSTTSRASGLIDEEGYFWRDVASLRAHLVPEAAEAELRAQIERAIAAGLRPTHIDAHMAAAMLPELIDLHVRLAFDYGLVPVLPRGDPLGARTRELCRGGGAARCGRAAGHRPFPRHIAGRGRCGRGALSRDDRGPPARDHAFRLACDDAGRDRDDFARSMPAGAPANTRCSRAARSANGCAANGITAIGYRDIQHLWRAGSGGA